jgi:hypothetical protein
MRRTVGATLTKRDKRVKMGTGILASVDRSRLGVKRGEASSSFNDSSIFAMAESDPAPRSFALRVAMRPVDDAALLVVLVLSAHGDGIARGDRHARGEVDVVGDKHGVAGWEVEDEALVVRALAVVRQEVLHAAGDFHGDAGEPLLICGFDVDGVC